MSEPAPSKFTQEEQETIQHLTQLNLKCLQAMETAGLKTRSNMAEYQTAWERYSPPSTKFEDPKKFIEDCKQLLETTPESIDEYIAVSQAAGYVLNDTMQQINRAPMRIQNEITKQVTQLHQDFVKTQPDEMWAPATYYPGDTIMGMTRAEYGRKVREECEAEEAALRARPPPPNPVAGLEKVKVTPELLSEFRAGSITSLFGKKFTCVPLGDYDDDDEDEEEDKYFELIGIKQDPEEGLLFMGFFSESGGYECPMSEDEYWERVALSEMYV